MLISKEVCVVSEDAVVCSAWDRDGEGSVHVISELEFKTEAHRLAELPAEVYTDLLLGDADVETLGEGQFDTDVGHVIKELAFEVAVLVAVVEDPEAGGGLDVEWYDGHDDLSFVEVEHRQRCHSFQ